VAAREEIPLTRPVLAIYSKRDGVVAWQACIDGRNGCVEHVEVQATHLGLGLSPQVYLLVANRLAGPGSHPTPTTGPDSTPDSSRKRGSRGREERPATSRTGATRARTM